MVARFGHQECARPKLPFRPLKFSPSLSLCCAFQRDIHAPSVRLNLLADLHILVSPRRGAFHWNALLVRALPAWMRGRKQHYSSKRSMCNPYFVESHITKTENYGLNSIGENHENFLTDTAAAILAGFQCCVHRSRNSCSRSFVPIPELTMIMIAQYNVRNYPPPPLTPSRTYYNNECTVQRTELPPPPHPFPNLYNEC